MSLPIFFPIIGKAMTIIDVKPLSQPVPAHPDCQVPVIILPHFSRGPTHIWLHIFVIVITNATMNNLRHIGLVQLGYGNVTSLRNDLTILARPKPLYTQVLIQKLVHREKGSDPYLVVVQRILARPAADDSTLTVFAGNEYIAPKHFDMELIWRQFISTDAHRFGLVAGAQVAAPALGAVHAPLVPLVVAAERVRGADAGLTSADIAAPATLGAAAVGVVAAA